MDNIWDRRSFEVGGHWPLWWGWKNRMSTQNRQKSNDKKNIIDKADMNSPTNVQQHHFVFNTSSHYLKKKLQQDRVFCHFRNPHASGMHFIWGIVYKHSRTMYFIPIERDWKCDSCRTKYPNSTNIHLQGFKNKATNISNSMYIQHIMW